MAEARRVLGPRLHELFAAMPGQYRRHMLAVYRRVREAGCDDPRVWQAALLHDAGKYDPATDTWTGTSTVGAPSVRRSHTAVWTGSVMVVWGGYGGTAGSFDTGGRYDPAADTWTATSTVGAPSARGGHTAVWTGSVMVVWGGNNLVTGGRYVLIAAAPPVANAGPDQTIECTGGNQAMVVLDGSRSTDPDSTPGTNDGIVNLEWFENFGTSSEVLVGTGDSLSIFLPLGPHEITLRVTDRQGKTSTDEIMATVVDTTPPQISLNLNPSFLWPPNHRMVGIQATSTATDACGGMTTVILESVTSSEPDDAVGDGDGGTTNDIQGALAGSADFAFSLRAERSASGPGRTYTVTYRSTDGSGNVSRASAFVTVTPYRK